jgi:hypothetical protein
MRSSSARLPTSRTINEEFWRTACPPELYVAHQRATCPD